MKKILRVGFAMGGGVSLGTFCGTALSQALKLLIIYGGYSQNDKFHRFDRIEVDVFSGASAGALSLAAMLRALAAPDPKKMSEVHDSLEKEFPGALDELNEDQRQDLYAAEVMQRFQKQLWSEEIRLDKLLAEDAPGDLPFKASLLDRGAVDDIAQRFIIEPEHGDFAGRRVLADRVLFASTLTNLTPVIWDASNNFPGKSVGYIGLNDGLRSSTHRDLRVFDLNFKKVTNPGSPFYADRWCLYHLGAEQEGLVGDLTKRATWAKIAATAIASGAFPGAFEPVVLPRKPFEFGAKRWNKIVGRPADAPLEGQPPLPFSYVDGGTLNNEPIREAFRLASFIDGHTRAEHPDANIHRLIVFVDPKVSSTRPSFRVPGHAAWLRLAPGKISLSDGPAVRRAPSFRRLVPHLFSLVGAVGSESTAIEGDKINAVRNQFGERDAIRQVLFETLTNEPKNEDLLDLMDFIESRLAEADRDDTIPAGPMTLPGELERVCHEEIAPDEKSPFTALRRGAADFAAEMRASGNVSHKALWLRLLAFVSVDLILRLEGKLQNASLVAIAPFRNLANLEQQREPDAIWLPGGALSGFAGFMSPLPDAIEHKAARYCAAEFLRACDMIDPQTPLPDPAEFMLTGKARPDFEAALAKDIQLGLEKIAHRAGAMLRDADLINIFPGLDGIVTGLLSGWVKSKIKGAEWRAKHEQACTFRVRVPNEAFEFDGETRDIDARPVKNPEDGAWELVTVATWDNDAQNWSGPYVKRNQLDIDQHGSGLSRDADFCDIKLPDAAMMREQELLPNPTFYIDLLNVDRSVNPVRERAWQPLPGVAALESSLNAPAAAPAAIVPKLVATVAHTVTTARP